MAASQAERIEMQDLIDHMAWGETPLGSQEQWPASVTTMVRFMLAAPQPMFLVWGPQQILLYNDALRPILGGKHPEALGRSFLEVWREVEVEMRPIVEAAYAGQPTQMDDLALVVERNGYPEEARFSFSFTPLASEAAAVDGFFCVCTETTSTVLTLRTLEAREAERDRFVRLVENSRDFIGMAELDGRVSYLNEAARELVGLDVADAAALQIADFFPAEDATVVAGQVLPAVLQQGYWAGELSFRHFKTGETIPILYHVFKIIDGNGTAIGYGTVTRDFRDRRKAEEALVQSEAKWRDLFETLKEGFILGELVRDGSGHPVDWRYEAVNDAWYDLLGLERGIAQGKTLRELIPNIEHEWVTDVATAVETGQPVRFTRQVGVIGRWFEGIVQPTERDRFTVLFLDVSDRIREERRQAALLTLGDTLRDCGTVEDYVQAATRCIAEGLEADRFGFGFVDEEAETVDILPDIRAPGLPSVAGHHSFRSFGSYIEDLKRGETVAIEDVERDPRTSYSAEAFAAIKIRALLNLPICEDGAFVLVVFAHVVQPHHWTASELAFIQQVGDRLQAALSRLRSEQRQETQNDELAHRMKNMLAIVQAITTQTLRQAETMEAGRLAISSRLAALARAQDILTRSSSAAEADVRHVVKAAIEPYGGIADRITASGPSHRLTAQQALGLSLAIHELGTNASKYGALSVEHGRIDITWSLVDGTFRFCWIESGGPAVTPPTRRGFGSKLIEQIVGSYFNGTGQLDHDPGGVRFELVGRGLAPAK